MCPPNLKHEVPTLDIAQLAQRSSERFEAGFRRRERVGTATRAGPFVVCAHRSDEARAATAAPKNIVVINRATFAVMVFPARDMKQITLARNFFWRPARVLTRTAARTIGRFNFHCPISNECPEVANLPIAALRHHGRY